MDRDGCGGRPAAGAAAVVEATRQHRRIAPRSPAIAGMCAVVWTILLLLGVSGAGRAAETLDPTRVREIAALLPEHPIGLGSPIHDRAYWQRLAGLDAFKAAVRQAERLLNQQLPELTEDLYLDFSRTGNRDRFEKPAEERRGRLIWLVLAECLEDKGRFLPAIAQVVTALCSERTWVYPACDLDLANIHGTRIDIDLYSSSLAWDLATADYILGGKLDPAARQLLRREVRRRVLEPFRQMITGAREPNWWLTDSFNWNAVCLACVTGTALAELETREERALFAAAAIHYTRRFLRGFGTDGYCVEGPSYWDYGFGHYLMLSETLRRATHRDGAGTGALDLLALPQARPPALYALGAQIVPGLFPTFADSKVGILPSRRFLHCINRRLGLGLPEYAGPEPAIGRLYDTLIFAAPTDAAAGPTPAGSDPARELRTWFPDAGVLIARPAPGSSCRLAVALKGGSNTGSHYHLDLGTYIVACNGRPVLVDPGTEVYTARTNGPGRWESKLLNTFGHPVPIVAGQLQRNGPEAQARVTRRESVERSETLELDLTSAYPVPTLKSLRRLFSYSRDGAGVLTVTDTVEYAKEQAFGTAMVTFGKWQRLGDGSFLISDGGDALRVEVDTQGQEYAFRAEPIMEDAPVRATRLGIDLARPVTSASIVMRVTPLRPATNGNLLDNGGFEYGACGWDIPTRGPGEVTNRQAASGFSSLRLATQAGVWAAEVTSTPLPIAGPGEFELKGALLRISGAEMGVYVRFLDQGGKLLNTSDSRGWYQPVGKLAGAGGKWEPFSFRFRPPEGTVSLQLWLHRLKGTDSFELFLDDLAINGVQ